MAARALEALKPLANMARKECLELPESDGSMPLRWEIYSTWLLLLCLFYTEAEAERCPPDGLAPRPWTTEAQALQHVYLQSHTLRVLCGLLRWLRCAPGVGTVEDEDVSGDGRHERTRSRLRQQRTILQPPLAMHPDGPLQQPHEYDPDDLEDEECLLRCVFLALRRGDLRGAMKMCDEGGQPWRAAFLLGMLPFAEGGVEEDGNDYDEDAKMLGVIKEQHADWTEVGCRGGGDGNPWRRIWKEQCCDIVQRHLGKASSPMSATELGIYGFCAGRLEALRPACSSGWADELWAELHCLKECFVEELLDASAAECECPQGYFLGEGDCGVPDPTESEASREARREKLSGPLFRAARRGGGAEAVEAVAAERLRQILRSFVDPAGGFAAAQAAIALLALHPAEGSGEVLGMLRRWLGEGLGGGPCPFAVKRFVARFAIWQKRTEGAASAEPGGDQDIDDLVREVVGEQFLAASRRWRDPGPLGGAIKGIADDTSAMSASGRLSAWAELLLRLGPSWPGDAEPARAEALRRCLRVFWGEFPMEAPELLVATCRRALQLGEAEDEIPEIGPIGVSGSARTGDMVWTLTCAEVYWAVAREWAEQAPAAAGLRELLRGRCEDGGLLEATPAATSPRDFCLGLLGGVVLPVVVDALLALAARDPAEAIVGLAGLESSPLWDFEALHDVKWFLGLCERKQAWDSCVEKERAARARAPVSRRLLGGFGAAPGADPAEANRLRDDLLDFARPILAQDYPLLEVMQGTTLPHEQWQRLSSTVIMRAVFMLLSVFEGDLGGAMDDLVVAMARSPWLLSRMEPRHARAFLQRLAAVPLWSEDPRLCSQLPGDAAAEPCAVNVA